MSPAEQDAVVGRLVRERTEANRQCALIADELTNKFSSRASNLYGSLTLLFKGEIERFTDRATRTIEVVDELDALGGLDRIKSLLSEYLQLAQRISEISQTLRKAGAE